MPRRTMRKSRIVSAPEKRHRHTRHHKKHDKLTESQTQPRTQPRKRGHIGKGDLVKFWCMGCHEYRKSHVHQLVPNRRRTSFVRGKCDKCKKGLQMIIATNE